MFCIIVCFYFFKLWQERSGLFDGIGNQLWEKGDKCEKQYWIFCGWYFFVVNIDGVVEGLESVKGDFDGKYDGYDVCGKILVELGKQFM